tara:strand:- start:3085 stop:3750 length:666 start_codon:yes stop_codon:yes gene_type:complete
LIRLENFSIKDNLKRKLINNVNLFIPSGSIVLIDGNHSSGKTMLLRAIGLIDEPSEGNLHLLGRSIKKLNRYELSSIHSEIGIVFQGNNFVDNFDLESNIIFPLILKKEIRKDINLALQELLPWLNLEQTIKKEINQLSSAELKLAQFARAIIGRPRILLLDNFFMDIEINMQKKINYLLLALNKIGTSIIVTGKCPEENIISFSKKYFIDNKSLVERVNT